MPYQQREFPLWREAARLCISWGRHWLETIGCLPNLRKHLQQLESLPSVFPLQDLQDILVRELGQPDHRGIRLLPPLAEASVAVVVPFQIQEQQGEGPREGVFKILKPGIRERLEEELEMLERTGSYLDGRFGEFGIPAMNYRETFEQVRVKLLCEVRLDLEQRNLGVAHITYSDQPRVVIPALFGEYCTLRVTAMERVSGQKVTEANVSYSWKKSILPELIISELIVRPLFSKNGLFHADPHAGNIFLTRDHRLAILDWSLTGSLTERERIQFAAIILGAMTLHPGRIEAAIEELSDGPKFDRSVLNGIVRSAIDKIREGRLPGLTWATGILDEAVTTAGLHFGADLLMFRRVIHVLNGVIRDIGAGAHLADDVLIRKFISAFLLEWPFRWLAPPASREFTTRLSNTDIAELMFSLPWTTARFWLGSKW